MARFLSPTLIPRSRPLLSSFRLLNLRARSNKPEKVQLVEIDLGDAATATEGGEEAEFKMGMSKLEDAIHLIMAMRSAPDWLPFVPGSSYWVPPMETAPASCSYKVVQLVREFRDPMTEEEAMSLTTVRGWPSTAFFVEGNKGLPPVPLEENPEKKKKSNRSDEEDA